MGDWSSMSTTEIVNYCVNKNHISVTFGRPCICLNYARRTCRYSTIHGQFDQCDLYLFFSIIVLLFSFISSIKILWQFEDKIRLLHKFALISSHGWLSRIYWLVIYKLQGIKISFEVTEYNVIKNQHACTFNTNSYLSGKSNAPCLI